MIEKSATSISSTFNALKLRSSLKPSSVLERVHQETMAFRHNDRLLETRSRLPS